MEHIFEQMVLGYLTKDPYVFVSPQYDIGKGWSCPDFVKLDFKEREVSVVEVSVAWDVTRLAKKVRDAKTQWLTSCDNN